jgi:hypothetical protein
MMLFTENLSEIDLDCSSVPCPLSSITTKIKLARASI